MSSAAAAREPLPPRPYLPPSMAGALAACTGSAAFMRAGWRAFVSADAATLGGLWAAACGASILAVLVAALVRALLARRTSRASRWISAAAVWAAGAFAVCALSSACVVGERFGELDALVAHPMSSYVFAPAADGRFGAYGFQVAADVLLPDGTRVGGVLLSLDEEPRAARLRLVGRCVRFEDEPWDRSRFMAGAVAEVEAVRVQDEAGASEAGIGAVRAQALSVIDPASSPARALVAGIVCGRTTELAQTEGQEWFSATGTSHLVAVSGSHLAFVSSLAGVVLERTRTPLAARSCLLFALAAAYVVFTGGAASAVRSLIMVASASAPRALGRRAHGPSGLSLAVMLMLAVDPGTVFDLGFQLSVASVLFIGLFFRYLAWHVEAWGAPALLAEPLALTLSAQWATLPVTVPVFGEVSLIAPVANLVLGPVMSALLVAGLVLAPVAMAVPALTAAALAPLDLIASIALFTAELMADAPGALLVVDSESATLPVAAVLLALAAGAYALWRRIPRAFAVGALAALLVIAGAHAARWRFFAPAAVTVLDVGQGDAILVRDGTDAVLVDCGVDDAVASALARASVMHLDAVVITHWDRDHWGGLGAVLDAVEVDAIIVAEGAERSVPSEAADLDLPEMQTVGPGDAFAVGGFRCRDVWPTGSVAGEENGDSLVLDVRYERDGRSLSVLLTGDTEADEAARYAESVGDIDVLKMGHHGSAVSVDAEMLKTLDPELAVASAGEGNAYGHPDPAAVALVRELGARFLCTIEAGDVALEPAEGGFRVGTLRGLTVE